MNVSIIVVVNVVASCFHTSSSNRLRSVERSSLSVFCCIITFLLSTDALISNTPVGSVRNKK